MHFIVLLYFFVPVIYIFDNMYIFIIQTSALGLMLLNFTRGD